jgi:hypothetical protein
VALPLKRSMCGVGNGGSLTGVPSWVGGWGRSPEHPWWDAIGPETRLDERIQSGPGCDPGDRGAPGVVASSDGDAVPGHAGQGGSLLGGQQVNQCPSTRCDWPGLARNFGAILGVLRVVRLRISAAIARSRASREGRWRQTCIRQHQQWPACVLLLEWHWMNFAATVRKFRTI